MGNLAEILRFCLYKHDAYQAAGEWEMACFWRNLLWYVAFHAGDDG